AGRVVLRRLALLGAGLVGREADVGVGRRDLRDPRLVDDRDRDRARARVELADVADRLVVLGDLARVLGGLCRVPVAGLRRGVVERLVLDGHVTGLAARLLQGELDALHHGRGLVLRRALQRKRRVDLDGLAAATAGGRRTGAGAAATTAVVVVVAARGHAEG